MVRELVLAPEVDSPRLARAFVRRALAESGLTSELAVLLISEVATNAVLHARTDFVVRVHSSDERIRVEVADGNQRPPVIGHTPAEATSGRGLHLVQALSRAWGVEGHADGKTVWFEVGLDEIARPGAFAS